MRILITGAAGFLGRKLTAEILRRGRLADAGGAPEAVTELRLLDTVRGDPPQADGVRIDTVTGDLCDPSVLDRLVDGADAVFHLAAVVSAGAEADFDLGYRVNLDGTRALLEACRHHGRRPRLVFASTGAVFGGHLPEVLPDSQILTPDGSYGTQKAMGELLVADYTRKGFLDGRSLRLPTIVVRPGKPNLAASSFASSILREPLQGEEAVCPVPPEQGVWVLSPRRVIDAFLHALALPGERFTRGRRVSLAGLTVTVEEMVETLRTFGGDEAVARIRWEDQPEIARLVRSWPVAFTADYARELGFEADPDFRSIVQAFIEDDRVLPG